MKLPGFEVSLFGFNKLICIPVFVSTASELCLSLLEIVNAFWQSSSSGRLFIFFLSDNLQEGKSAGPLDSMIAMSVTSHSSNGDEDAELTVDLTSSSFSLSLLSSWVMMVFVMFCSRTVKNRNSYIIELRCQTIFATTAISFARIPNSRDINFPYYTKQFANQYALLMVNTTDTVNWTRHSVRI